MSSCIFCKIISGEIPSVKIWQDENFLAILDLFPNTRGMTLVLPKKHYDSYTFNLPEDIYKNFFIAAKKVGKILEEGLKVQRVALVMEGMGVNHAHIKLYPLHGLEENFRPVLSKESVFFDKYQGFLTTKLGPQASAKDLEAVAKLICVDKL